MEDELRRRVAWMWSQGTYESLAPQLEREASNGPLNALKQMAPDVYEGVAAEGRALMAELNNAGDQTLALPWTYLEVLVRSKS